MAKYRIDRTEPRDDGSGNVAWEVWALDDDDFVIPGRHTWIETPYDEAQEALDGPNVAEKIKTLLKKYFPDVGWSSNELDEIVANNENAQTVDQNIDDFVEGVGGYPVTITA